MFVQLRKEIARLLIVVILSLSLVPIASAEVLSQDTAPGSLADSAIQTVAEANGLVKENLEVVYSAAADFAMQGIAATAFKVADRQSEEIYSVLLDANGKVLDQAAIG